MVFLTRESIKPLSLKTTYMKIIRVNKIITNIFVFFAICTQAQISEGGLPYSFHKNNVENDIFYVKMPKVDNEILCKQEILDKTGGFQFGKEFDVELNLLNSGQWVEFPNGDRLWQLGVSSENAYSINLIFDNFYIPANAKFFIYTKDKNYVLGAFTEKNNNPERFFSTTLLPGSEIVLEYFEPKEVRNQGMIHLSTVVHGYKDFFFKAGPYGSSGSCHVNINCPEGVGFKDIKRSVALILNGSFAHCTGTLINNTKNDGTPYFLTAQHCVTGKNLSRFVFVFGYETENCDGTNGNNGASISGASLVADGDYSDFALLKLSSAPPLSYNPYYVGWNKQNLPAITSACIHHPSGDYKKISFCNTIVNSSNYEDYPKNTHWEVTAWTLGSTEGGSSGAPLFNQNKLLVGQLEGGTALCNNQGYDVFGKLSYSWLNNNNESSDKRLKDWLDPLNTGVNTLEAYDPCIPSFNTDACLNKIVNPTTSVCQFYVQPKIVLKNNGSDTLEYVKLCYKLNENEKIEFIWTGKLAFGETEVVDLPFSDVTDGNYLLNIWLENPNHTSDQNPINDTISISFTYQKGIPVSWIIKTDVFPQQTSWLIKDINGNIVAQNPVDLSALNKYANTFCLDTGCYDFVIYDSNGDGLSGNEGTGKGYYYFYLMNKIILSGVDFEYKDSIRFCLDETSNVNSFSVNKQNENINIYPNPANSLITLSAKNLCKEEIYQASFYTLDGKKLKEKTIHEGDNIIELNSLPQGLYVVKIQSKQHCSTHKLMIYK